MKISSLLAVLLCALPLAAQTGATATAAPAAPSQEAGIEAPADAGPRRVVAPCRLVEASIGPSGEESPADGPGFGIHIVNNSQMTLDFPSYPELGWRIETLKGKNWKVKAEGGPVRPVGSPSDPHMAVIGPTGSGAMVHVQPTFFRDYRFFLQGMKGMLRHEGTQTTFRVTVYWAASTAMKRADPAAPNCAVTADWIVSIGP